MSHRWIAICVAAACGVSLVAAPMADAGAPASGAASSSFTRGAGLLPKLKHLGSTKMRVVVPKVPCTKKTPDASITVGMFGSIHRGKHDDSWLVAVRASCIDGHRHAVGNFLSFNSNGLRVHPGDVVVLKQRGAMEYSVDDRTTGAGFGGAAGSGPGPAPRPSTKILFGGRLTGHLDKPVTVSVTNALVHGKPFGKQKWTGQQQVRKNGKVVGDPGPLSKDGRQFPLNFS